MFVFPYSFWMEFSISDYCGVSTYVHSLLLLLQRSHCSFSPADCCTYYIGRLFSSQSQIMAWSPHLAHAITGDLLHLVNLRWSACRGGFNQALARWLKSPKISPKSVVNFVKRCYLKRESTLKNYFLPILRQQRDWVGGVRKMANRF